MCVCVCVHNIYSYISSLVLLSLAGWTLLSPHRPRHPHPYDTANVKRCENSISKHYLNLVSLYFITNVSSICYHRSEVLQLYHFVKYFLSLLLYSGFCSVFCGDTCSAVFSHQQFKYLSLDSENSYRQLHFRQFWLLIGRAKNPEVAGRSGSWRKSSLYTHSCRVKPGIGLQEGACRRPVLDPCSLCHMWALYSGGLCGTN